MAPWQFVIFQSFVPFVVRIPRQEFAGRLACG